MSPRRPTLALLVVVSLLLLTNPLWLFPHEGDTRYTYERSEIVVENRTLTYHGRDIPDFGANNLDPVGCQPQDRTGARACAFDQHLVEYGPVTVPRGRALGAIRPDFVRIDGAYYRRIHRPNDSDGDRTVTHDVERVEPRTVLAESAIDLSDVQRPFPDSWPLAFRIAASGDVVTTYERVEDDELGAVYRRNGSYYTVVRTDETNVDGGPDFLRYDSNRAPLVIAGGLLLLWTLPRAVDDWRDRT